MHDACLINRRHFRDGLLLGNFTHKVDTLINIPHQCKVLKFSICCTNQRGMLQNHAKRKTSSLERPLIFLSGLFQTLEPGKRPRTDISAAYYSWDRWFWRPRPLDGAAGPTHSEGPGCPGRNSSPPGAPPPPCGWRARRAAARAPRATQRLPCCCRGRRERLWERKCPASREAEAEVPGKTKSAAGSPVSAPCRGGRCHLRAPLLAGS